MSQIPYTQWIPLPLVNGWKAGVPGYTPAYRQEGDIVRLCGNLDGTATAGNNMPVSALPIGIQPAVMVYVPSVQLVMAGSLGQVACALQISGNSIQVLTHYTIDGFVYLDGLNYRLR